MYSHQVNMGSLDPKAFVELISHAFPTQTFFAQTKKGPYGIRRTNFSCFSNLDLFLLRQRMDPIAFLELISHAFTTQAFFAETKKGPYGIFKANFSGFSNLGLFCQPAKGVQTLSLFLQSIFPYNFYPFLLDSMFCFFYYQMLMNVREKAHRNPVLNYVRLAVKSVAKKRSCNH